MIKNKYQAQIYGRNFVKELSLFVRSLETLVKELKNLIQYMDELMHLSDQNCNICYDHFFMTWL